ncbi:hypothetical protein OG317_36345 [Streptomyces sp. NBC_01167]|nr:hypothetical protein OG317_36345 [Streptomyces sp. NBC_01167]
MATGLDGSGLVPGQSVFRRELTGFSRVTDADRTPSITDRNL